MTVLSMSGGKMGLERWEQDLGILKGMKLVGREGKARLKKEDEQEF